MKSLINKKAMDRITVYPRNAKQKSLLKSLLEEMKAKMKIAVAIGMAAMTFAGAGGIKEAEAGVKLKNGHLPELATSPDKKRVLSGGCVNVLKAVLPLERLLQVA